MKKFLPIFALTVAVSLASVLPPGKAKCVTPSPVNITSCPRATTEILHYEFGWNGVIAAGAKIEVRMEDMNSIPVLRILANAQTVGMARNLWKMDDRMEAIVHRDTLNPIRVDLQRQEAGQTFRTTTSFSPATGEANVIEVAGTKVKKRTLKIGKVNDPLTLILLFRCLDLKAGSQATVDVIESDRVYRVLLNVVAKETIHVKAGNFEAYKIAPVFYKLKKNNRLIKEDIKAEDVFLWVGAQPDRYFLKIESKAFIGSVTGELVKVEKK